MGKTRRLATMLTALMAIGAARCAGPCESLASQVCDCEPTTAQAALCERLNRNAESNFEGGIRDEENKRCEAYLDRCTCQALALGDYAACGLTSASTVTPAMP